MASTFELVEGWTDPIDCILLGDDVALNLTGISVAMVAYSTRGILLTLAGAVSVPSPSTGQVRFTPTATDLVEENSPMLVRWKLTSGLAIRFVPNSPSPDEWVVSKP